MGELPSSGILSKKLKHINIEKLHTTQGGFHVSSIQKTKNLDVSSPYPWPFMGPFVASDIFRWAPQTSLHLLMRFKCIELSYQISTSANKKNKFPKGRSQ